MHDDFRITLELEGDGLIDELLERFRAGGVEREAADALGERVVISRDGGRLLLYAATGEDAHAGEAAVRPLLEAHGLRAAPGRLERWHPDAEEWEDAELPLPATDAEREAERAERRRAEREDSERAGYAEWEVRIELTDTVSAWTLGERLRSEGLPVIRRSHYLLVGAASEDDATALAERLRAEAPGARLEVEGSQAAVWSATHPFSVFGGLAG